MPTTPRPRSRASPGARDPADAVVPHVRLREPPEHARLEVRRVEDEARPVGDVLEGGAFEELPVVPPGDEARDRARQEDPLQAGGDVDRLAGQAADRRDDRLLESLGDAGPVESELGPAVSEDAGRDRSSRDAGDTVELSQPAQLVQPPERADVEDHRAVAPARETERDPRLRSVPGRVGRESAYGERPSTTACSGFSGTLIPVPPPQNPSGSPSSIRIGSGSPR